MEHRTYLETGLGVIRPTPTEASTLGCRRLEVTGHEQREQDDDICSNGVVRVHAVAAFLTAFLAGLRGIHYWRWWEADPAISRTPGAHAKLG